MAKSYFQHLLNFLGAPVLIYFAPFLFISGSGPTACVNLFQKNLDFFSLAYRF